MIQAQSVILAVPCIRAARFSTLSAIKPYLIIIIRQCTKTTYRLINSIKGCPYLQAIRHLQLLVQRSRQIRNPLWDRIPTLSILEMIRERNGVGGSWKTTSTMLSPMIRSKNGNRCSLTLRTSARRIRRYSETEFRPKNLETRKRKNSGSLTSKSRFSGKSTKTFMM